MLTVRTLVWCTVTSLLVFLFIIYSVFQSSSSKNIYTEHDLLRDVKELNRFRDLLSIWPKDKPKAAVYTLILSKNFYILLQNLKLFEKYFNHKYNYPVIIFYEGEITDAMKVKANSLSRSFFFQKVNFSVPDFIKGDLNYDVCYPGHVGYRHMCRFHSLLVFEHPIMQGLEWYWRVDDDSAIFHEIDYDIFKYMKMRDFKIGYTIINKEYLPCLPYFRSNVSKYVQDRGIDKKLLDAWPEDRQIYTNFEIGSISFWKSKPVWDFLNYIDNVGGIYYYRWGDAPIKSHAVALFLPENKRHLFKDIFYVHQLYISGPLEAKTMWKMAKDDGIHVPGQKLSFLFFYPCFITVIVAVLLYVSVYCFEFIKSFHK